MNKHIWWAWTLKNSIAIVCWTILAIYFNKWWIALFAALFLSSLSTENRKDDKDGNSTRYCNLPSVRKDS